MTWLRIRRRRLFRSFCWWNWYCVGKFVREWHLSEWQNFRGRIHLHLPEALRIFSHWLFTDPYELRATDFAAFFAFWVRSKEAHCSLAWTLGIQLNVSQKKMICHKNSLKRMKSIQKKANEIDGSIQCILWPLSQCGNASTDSFHNGQKFSSISLYRTLLCLSFAHHVVPFVIAVLLTVFMLSLGCLVHSGKYLRWLRVRVQGIDAFKMILFTNSMSIQFNGWLEIQFSIISSFWALPFSFRLTQLLRPPNWIRRNARPKMIWIFPSVFQSGKIKRRSKKDAFYSNFGWDWMRLSITQIRC